MTPKRGINKRPRKQARTEKKLEGARSSVEHAHSGREI